MAFSFNDTSDVSEGDTLTVPFPYISKDHVYVYADGVVVSNALYEWTSPSTINCLAGFPSCQICRVQRVTPREDIPTEQQGTGVYDFEGANANDVFLLYLQQEEEDKESISPALRFVDNNPLDAEGRKIINVGTPTASTDAATKGFVEGKYSEIYSSIQSHSASANAAKVAAEEARDGAEASEIIAGNAETQTLAALVLTEGARDAALAAQAVSEGARDISTTKASEASTSAATATTKASEASTSAATATTKASEASASAANAALSSDEAESAEAGAAAALSSFYDMFIGAASGDPSVDLNGDPVVEGQIYWNTTSKEMRVHNGTTFETAYVPGGSYLIKTNNLSDVSDAVAARGNLSVPSVAEVNAALANSGAWDVAYSWGNHADAGYLTETTSQTVSGAKTFTGGVVLPPMTEISAQGTEGGEVVLKKGTGQPNLGGDIHIDTFGDVVRLYENGGSYRQFVFNLVDGAISVPNGNTVRNTNNTPEGDNSLASAGADTTPRVWGADDLKVAAETHGGGFGVGQTWQNMTGSRAYNTTYQNTSGKPIEISLWPSNATSGTVEVSPDNSTWESVASYFGSGQDVRQVQVTIPKGAYYRLTGSGAIPGWREMR